MWMSSSIMRMALPPGSSADVWTALPPADRATTPARPAAQRTAPLLLSTAPELRRPHNAILPANTWGCAYVYCTLLLFRDNSLASSLINGYTYLCFFSFAYKRCNSTKNNIIAYIVGVHILPQSQILKTLLALNYLLF